MMRRWFLVLQVAGLLVGCAGMEPYSPSSPVARGQSPIILDAYAAPSVRPGDTWMIFLKAEAPDGEMKSIAAVLWQAGVGYYPTEVTILKPDNRKQFSGYLYLQTPALFTLNYDELELYLYVRDAQGNGAQPIKLPLRFDMAARQVVPEKWQEAANNRIAALMFDMESAMRYNRGGGGGDVN